MTDMLLWCEVLRGEREIDRLLMKLALDPILAAAIARCQRPYIDSRPLREQGKTAFPLLTIACPDRETADVLHHAVPWGWYYLPFQGGCFGLCLQFPGGKYHFTPDDPRVLAFETALPCLLSKSIVTDLAIEYEAAPWAVRGTQGWQNAEPDTLEHFPSLCLVCLSLEALNACRDRAELLLNLAAALIPTLKRLTLLYWPHGRELDSAEIMLDWERAAETWQCITNPSIEVKCRKSSSRRRETEKAEGIREAGRTFVRHTTSQASPGS